MTDITALDVPMRLRNKLAALILNKRTCNASDQHDVEIASINIETLRSKLTRHELDAISFALFRLSPNDAGCFRPD